MKLRVRSTVLLAITLCTASSIAGADPVHTSSYSYRYDWACASWYQEVGNDYSEIEVCGQVSGGSEGYEYRRVEATRSAGTCDEDGCTDTYEERYFGPADDAEFTMDIQTGVASIDIVLSGETAGDECAVKLDLTAQDEPGDDDGDSWPSFRGRIHPEYPYVEAESGNRTIGASAGVPYRAEVSDHDYSSESRWAQASGQVCDWISNTQPTEDAWLDSYTESSSYTSVDATDL